MVVGSFACKQAVLVSPWCDEAANYEAPRYGGVMLSVGDVVPEFELLDQHGHAVAFSELIDGGYTVLFFYIKAKTPG